MTLAARACSYTFHGVGLAVVLAVVVTAAAYGWFGNDWETDLQTYRERTSAQGRRELRSYIVVIVLCGLTVLKGMADEGWRCSSGRIEVLLFPSALLLLTVVCVSGLRTLVLVAKVRHTRPGHGRRR